MQSRTLLLAAFLLAALLTTTPLAAHAACTPTRSVSEDRIPTRSVSEANHREPRILVPFALPIGLPVAPFAPYFYSAAQFQPVQVSNLPPSAAGSASAASVLNPEPRTLNPLAAHCSSCHAGPSPKAGLALDHPDALPFTDRLRAIRAVASGQMPKGPKLTDDEIRALIQELTQNP